jgi:hypothetical protein
MQSAAASRADQLRALSGMTNLYGTTPGMAQLYGDQVLSAIGQSGTQGGKTVDRVIDATKAPGQYEQTKGRINDTIDTAGRIAYPLIDQYQASRNKPAANTPTAPPVGTNPGYGNVPAAPPTNNTGGIGGAIPNTDPRMRPRR